MQSPTTTSRPSPWPWVILGGSCAPPSRRGLQHPRRRHPGAGPPRAWARAGKQAQVAGLVDCWAAWPDRRDASGLFAGPGKALHPACPGPTAGATTTGPRPNLGARPWAPRAARPATRARTSGHLPRSLPHPQHGRGPARRAGSGLADALPRTAGPSTFTEPTPAGPEARPSRAQRTAAIEPWCPVSWPRARIARRGSPGTQGPAARPVPLHPSPTRTALPHRPDPALPGSGAGSRAHRPRPRPSSSAPTGCCRSAHSRRAPVQTRQPVSSGTQASTEAGARAMLRSKVRPRQRPLGGGDPVARQRIVTPCGSGAVSDPRRTPRSAYRPRIAHANPFPRLYPDSDRTFTSPPPLPQPPPPRPPSHTVPPSANRFSSELSSTLPHPSNATRKRRATGAGVSQPTGRKPTEQ